MTDVDVDVIQVGYGPAGQVLAAYLGQRGHSVAVLERWPETYRLPRAGHLDHEAMRILQSIGAMETFRLQAIPLPDYNLVNADGEVLIHFDWDSPNPSGWKSDYFMFQPELEEAVDEAVRRHPSVNIDLGWEVSTVVDRGDHVEVHVRRLERIDGKLVPTGEEKTITARYVVGADGANSLVRTQAGIEWEDLGFQEQWLVTDIEPHDPDMEIDMQDTAQICDPKRPTSAFRWLGRHTARWEFMLHKGEDPEQMRQDENVWSLLSKWKVTPENSTLMRKTVYTFRSLIASTFRKGRMLLLGDAAHLMPPFMGQGLCSGMRDAANLAWKLDLVLSGRAPDALLDSYTVERRPHARKLIEASMHLGRVICTADPDEAAARDAAFLAGEVPPVVFPWLEEGILDGGMSTDVLGRLGLQARVVRGGVDGLADDLLGTGWTVLSGRKDFLDDLDERQQSIARALGMQRVHLSQAVLDSEVSANDIDAEYVRWFRRLGAPIVVVRPDFYVFGTAHTSAELGALLERLADRVGLFVDAATAAGTGRSVVVTP
ncbi:bifunctional 3-(3-hydroxy-phenyl)propionate/3-hydroxycinnamic acid hydroxylase [Brevibacterium ammoniilyticum]|uniref:Bifunctional 3-(3-hydroxy-phenyl)propionate/3-hydroxycinnamic acid hydroxylase n=1 Tax=Brevibacterium ammoniilyticum TaxID=1046555 RepID=A0ABP9U1B2_9MICO